MSAIMITASAIQPPVLLKTLVVKIHESYTQTRQGQITYVPVSPSSHVGAVEPVVSLYLWSDGLVTWTEARDYLQIGSSALVPGQSIKIQPRMPEVWWDNVEARLFFRHVCLDTDMIDALPATGWTSTTHEDSLSVSPAIRCARCGTEGWWRGNVWLPA